MPETDQDLCCPECFSDPFLRKLVRSRGSTGYSGRCAWCDSASGRRLAVSQLASAFQAVAEEFFVRLDDMPNAKYLDPLDGDKLGDALDERFAVFSDRAGDSRNDLADAIVDADWDPRDGGSSFGDTVWFPKTWNPLEQDAGDEIGSAIHIVAEAVRKFGHALDPRKRRPGYSSELAAAIRIIDAELAEHAVRLNKDYTLYRARVQKWSEPEDLRAPPAAKATPGRANLAGQPFLYLADSEDTAVAEVRPSLGDEVTVARFVLLRPARFCALVRTPIRSSPFKDARKYRRLTDRGIRREELGRAFAEPVPTYASAQDYLLTQFIAGLMRQRRFDGIMFRSAQRGGHPSTATNFVLFDPEHAEPVTMRVLKVRGIEYTLEPIEVLRSPTNPRWEWLNNVDD
jgi:hypothetical protein